MSNPLFKQELVSSGLSDPAAGQGNRGTGTDDKGGDTPIVRQSQDYRIYPATGTPKLILSVSDESPPSFALDIRHSLSIYTENFLVQRSIRSSHGNIEILTHSLALAPAAHGETYSADCSGTNGEKVPVDVIVEAPKDGNDGGRGGILRLVAEDIGLDNALEGLNFAARGGSGSDAQSSATAASGGKGGNGADGGRVEVLVGNEFTAILSKLAVIYESLSPASHGASASSPSPTASMYNLKTLSATIRRSPRYTSMDDVLPRLDKLDAAIQGAKPDEVKASLQDLAVRFEREGDLLKGKIQPRIKVDGGSGGSGGSGTLGRGTNGAHGKDGNYSVDFLTGDSGPVRNSEIMVAHPDQCRMLLEKARRLYSFDDIGSTVDSHTLLIRLQGRLSFLRQLQNNDKLYKAYEAAEARFFIPLDTDEQETNAAPETGSSSISALRQVLSEATGLVTQIDNGLDYYGNPGTYAPMLSYNSYEELTGSLLESSQQAEAAYDKFTKEAAAQEARQAALQDMQKQCNVAINKAEDTIPILQADIKKTANAIANLTAPLNAARGNLHDRIEQEKDTINKSFNLFHMSFSNIIDAVSMVIFCPKAPMAVAQTAGLLWKAGTNVPDDKGELINKSYLVSQITQIEATTDALDEGLKARDQGVDIDDPGAAKLIAARDDMMKLLNQYSGVLGSNNLAEMEGAFDGYINLVDQRNTAVLHYNACVNLWYTNQQRKAYYTDKRDSLSDTVIESIDPDLPALSVFVQKAYSDSVVAVMEALYLAQRSYRFAALTTDHPLSASLAGMPPSAMRHADLVRASSGILTAYMDAMNAWGRGPQEFRGTTWPLADAEWAALRSTSLTFVSIPPATADMSEAQHPFANRSNVRITTVRLFVTGAAQTANGFLSAKLTHNGAETIVDAANQQFQFYHNPLTREFRYRLAAGDFEPGVDGTVDGDMSDGGATADAKDRFALLGPFTTWSIDLDGNAGLDFSNATGAYLKFYGKFYPFS